MLLPLPIPPPLLEPPPLPAKAVVGIVEIAINAPAKIKTLIFFITVFSFQIEVAFYLQESKSNATIMFVPNPLK
jgi:hypothetical protein